MCQSGLGSIEVTGTGWAQTPGAGTRLHSVSGEDTAATHHHTPSVRPHWSLSPSVRAGGDWPPVWTGFDQGCRDRLGPDTRGGHPAPQCRQTRHCGHSPSHPQQRQATLVPPPRSAIEASGTGWAQTPGAGTRLHSVGRQDTAATHHRTPSSGRPRWSLPLGQRWGGLARRSSSDGHARDSNSDYTAQGSLRTHVAASRYTAATGEPPPPRFRHLPCTFRGPLGRSTRSRPGRGCLALAGLDAVSVPRFGPFRICTRPRTSLGREGRDRTLSDSRRRYADGVCVRLSLGTTETPSCRSVHQRDGPGPASGFCAFDQRGPPGSRRDPFVRSGNLGEYKLSLTFRAESQPGLRSLNTSGEDAPIAIILFYSVP